MVEPADLLREAIAAARAGRELTARELFLRVVRNDPHNKLAWLWLIGLLDSLDDQIAACERLLAIDPSEAHAKRRLDELLRKRSAEKLRGVKSGLDQAQELISKGEDSQALQLLRRIVKEYDGDEQTWLLLADLTPHADEKVEAYQKVLASNPVNVQAKEGLRQAAHFQREPFDLASLYEEQGKIDQAIAVYQKAGLHAKTNDEWNRIYHNITRLEDLKKAGIRHVSPTVSIARLTAGPPLLYFSLMLLQVGLDVFYPAPVLWLGMAAVLVGAFFLALATVRSRHRIWALFGETGAGGSSPARFLLGASGWMIMILPFALLFLDSFDRLTNFIIPPFPFPEW